jgi:hypothetical protein
MSVMPDATASSTTYWIAGLSTTGSISFGWAFVAGRNLIPRPAAGITTFIQEKNGQMAYNPLLSELRISDVTPSV